jgi:MFS family permease
VSDDEPTQRAQPSAQGLIRTYLAIVGLYTTAASMIWGINTLYLLDAGFTLAEVFFANAVFTGAMAAFEIPTGVVADVNGRRRSFLLSLAVLFIGTLGYVAVAELEAGFGALVGVSVFLGLGYTFYSGAVEAWLVDGLTEVGAPEQLDHVLARGAFISAAAMLLGTVGGGLLATGFYSLPYLIRAGLLAALFFLALGRMHDLGFSPREVPVSALPGEMKRIARESVQHGWSEKRIRLIILAAAAQAVFMAWGFHAWQPHFLALLGEDAAWIAGVIAALVAGAGMIGNRFVQFMTGHCGKRSTLLIGSSIAFSGAIVGVGLATSFWVAVPLYLVATMAMGVFAPVRQAYIHGLTVRDRRATVLSFASLVSSAGSMGGQAGLGQLTQTRSLADGYFYGGIASAVAIPLVVMLRRLGGGADYIGGSEGSPSGCAARGLAEVAGLETE